MFTFYVYSIKFTFLSSIPVHPIPTSLKTPTIYTSTYHPYTIHSRHFYIHSRNLQCTWYRTPKNERYFFFATFFFSVPYIKVSKKLQLWIYYKSITNNDFFSSFSHKWKKKVLRIQSPFWNLFLPLPSNVIVPIPCSHPHPFQRIFTYFFGSNQAQWFHYVQQGTSNDKMIHTIRKQLRLRLFSSFLILVVLFFTR